jgi:hypothetical protein
MAYSVRFKGLKELDRALGKADKDLRASLRDSLKDVASIVAVEARSIAQSKGLRQSGDLIAGIKPYALTGKAGVRSTAKHRGFGYPARLEFEGRGAVGTWGNRASLYPALDRKQDEVTNRTEKLLDDLVDELGGTP